MIDADLDKIHGKLVSRGFEEVALEHVKTNVEQVRFSRNSKDLFNNWNESKIIVFASRGKKTVSTNIKDMAKLDQSLDKLRIVSDRIPDNPAYEGLNPEKQESPVKKSFPERDYDLQDMASGMINSALEHGAERTAGLVYSKRDRVTVMTNYNECSYETGGIEAVIRSFRGEDTGQEGRHFGLSFGVDSKKMEQIGRESAEPLHLTDKIHDIEPGKFKVLMSPYVIGNIISYSSGFLSYYSVESGLSCFAESLNREVSSPGFTLVDDPLDSDGVGYRICDDEGTLTRRNTLIEDGTLKKFMHSYSTGKRAGEETTGNAGITYPNAWQLKILPGVESSVKTLSEMDEGLYINNCWYTRYQDYRNGVFSTVPRDGVFFVRNGEIQGSVKGIRISDSIPSILRNITSVSSDTKNVKWWEEISASNMPHVVAENVNISRAF